MALIANDIIFAPTRKSLSVIRKTYEARGGEKW